MRQQVNEGIVTMQYILLQENIATRGKLLELIIYLCNILLQYNIYISLSSSNLINVEEGVLDIQPHCQRRGLFNASSTERQLPQ